MKKKYSFFRVFVALSLMIVLGLIFSPEKVQGMKVGKIQTISVQKKTEELYGNKLLTGFRIQWSKVEGCTGYKVYVYGVASKKWRCIKTTKNTNYVITNLLAKTQLKVKVCAYQKAANGKITYGKKSKAVLCKAKNDVCSRDKNGAVSKSYIDRVSAEQAFALQNKYRKQGKVSKIKWSEELYGLCKIRVKQLSKDFSHNKWSSESKKYLKKNYGITEQYIFVKKNGVNYGRPLIGSENIAWGQKNYKMVMKTWKESTGHRQNYMSKSCKSGAIACYVSKDSGVYWIGIFSDVDFDKTVKKMKK